MQDDNHIHKETIKGIYTSLSVAKEEIWRRWNDKELREKVEKYLGKIPDFFQKEPRAVLFRNIISPDNEFVHFLELANELEMNPLGLEYVEDHFCTRNDDKIGLCKLNIFEKRNRDGNVIVRYEKIVDLMKNDNKKFSEIRMIKGENLVEFHHNLLKKNTNGTIEVRDLSQWIKDNGGSAKEYYKKLLAFFVCYGVLMDNFRIDNAEGTFTQEVFIPAFENIEKLFGCKPFIIPVVPEEHVDDRYWWCYDSKIMA